MSDIMSDIRLIYEPGEGPMSVAVFLSGSGTNFEAIYEEQKELEDAGERHYGRVDVVYTNVPGCRGAERAKEFGIPVVSLSSKRYFRDILEKNPGDEGIRDYYDAASLALVEEVCKPDLIVLAGYNRMLGKVFVSRYRNKILNVHPGDTTKGFIGLGKDPIADAIRAGEKYVKSTIFLVDETLDLGPVLIQSKSIPVGDFTEDRAGKLQEIMKREGDWLIYRFAVHHLIAKGRVGIDPEDNVYIDKIRMPEEGYQVDRYGYNYTKL